MNKIVLIISVLSVMFLLTNCSKEVEIPDANFKAYLLEKFDANKDGKISLSEAQKVTEINCSGRNIQDLTGIEKFVNLERLNCCNNQLDELELRYNKKLEWLVCNNNLDPLTIYFAASSPLRNRNFIIPKNAESTQVTNLINPFDVRKGIFDEGKTDFVICF